VAPANAFCNEGVQAVHGKVQHSAAFAALASIHRFLLRTKNAPRAGRGLAIMAAAWLMCPRSF
jgi:hypothetical protein